MNTGKSWELVGEEAYVVTEGWIRWLRKNTSEIQIF